MMDTVGLLLALTLPGLVVLLIALAAAERFGRWLGRGILPWHRGRAPVSAAGFDELTACLYAGKRIELDQRRVELVLSQDHPDSAPPRDALDRLVREQIASRGRAAAAPPST